MVTASRASHDIEANPRRSLGPILARVPSHAASMAMCDLPLLQPQVKPTASCATTDLDSETEDENAIELSQRVEIPSDLLPGRPKRERKQTALFSKEQARDVLGLSRKRKRTVAGQPITSCLTDARPMAQTLLDFQTRKRQTIEDDEDNIIGKKLNFADEGKQVKKQQQAAINVDLTKSVRNYATLTQLLRHLEIVLMTLGDQDRIGAFSKLMAPIMPINVNRYEEIIKIIDTKLLDKRQRQRVS